MLSRTLFLDFDGVLHPAQALDLNRFCHAKALSDAISPFDCRIVISSSWRFNYSLAELSAYLPQSLMARVVGMTGPAILGSYPRHNEILTWLMTSNSRDWRAVDDSAFEFPPRCEQLIHCEGSRGLGGHELEQIVQWLQC